MAPEGPTGTSEAVLGIAFGTSECKVCRVAADGAVFRTAREGHPTHSPDPGRTAPFATDVAVQPS